MEPLVILVIGVILGANLIVLVGGLFSNALLKKNKKTGTIGWCVTAIITIVFYGWGFSKMSAEEKAAKAAEEASRVELKIIERYVNDNGFKFFTLSNRDIVIVKKHSATFLDNKGNEQSCICDTYDSTSVHKWMDAEVGDVVQRKTYRNKHYYKIIVPSDTTTMTIVSRIEAPNENMFMSIFFENGKSIVIDAKEDPSWLTVQKGDTVIQKRMDGRKLFSPRL